MIGWFFFNAPLLLLLEVDDDACAPVSRWPMAAVFVFFDICYGLGTRIEGI